MPKSNEIGPNEAARMIVRGVLFSAPIHIQEKYQSFISPFFLSEAAPYTQKEAPDIANELLHAFVTDLGNIKYINLNEELTNDEIKNLVQEQVENVIAIAKQYMDKEDFAYYADFLSTITENVSRRKIVTYNYQQDEKSLQGTNDNDNYFDKPEAEIAQDCDASHNSRLGLNNNRFFTHFTADKDYSAEIERIKKESNPTQHLEDVFIDCSTTEEELEDFLDSENENKLAPRR
ncbi:hypothetical protein ACNVED_08215 [Legionella sp. D16C41]|uniref:hypothetical protein n=1 Tax=Legionella sp. D16C41 TaxID=3402688 RepID=UPI003AF52617